VNVPLTATGIRSRLARRPCMRAFCAAGPVRHTIALMTESALKRVTAHNLPAPVGPYSPGIIVGNLVYVSGQGARDPRTGEMPGDVETQTELVLRNVAAILEAAGSSLSHVIRCGVFLVDIDDFQRMNAAYARAFGDHRPARTTVQVSALPDKGLKVEIDAVALVPGL
jgi:2-iminobutanoate/2-iminopropanoate deaminase